MKKDYERPEMDLLEFFVEDVITESYELPGTPAPGKDDELPGVPVN